MTRLVVFGGSGVIGSAVLTAASGNANIDVTYALQRRRPDTKLPRVYYQRVEDFADLSGWRVLEQADAVIFALGISQSVVSEEHAYRRITLDYPLEAARRLAEMNPRAAFVFVSGEGADPSGKSRTLLARVKGEAENRLKAMTLARLVIARPAAVIPETWPRKPIFVERLVVPVARLLEPFAPALAIRAPVLGRALVTAALNAEISGLLDNRALRRLAGTD